MAEESKEQNQKSTTGIHNIESEDEEPIVEQLLLTIRECFVYKIPLLSSSSGYRAEDWDLANPLITAVLRLYQKGDTELILRLYQPGEGMLLFSECPVRIDTSSKKRLEHFIMNVEDSSRYFVIRVEEYKSKRHAFVGIGFRERQDAFDLKAALSDFSKYTQRVILANSLTAKRQQGEDDGSRQTSDVPRLDLKLKEGEKLKLNLRKALDHQDKEEIEEQARRAMQLRPSPSSTTSPVILPPPSFSESSTTPASEDEWSDFVQG